MPIMPSGRIVDLTLTMTDNMTAHKMFQSPVIITHMRHPETISYNLGVPGDPMTFQTNFLSTLDHVGTHVDAFLHTNPKGQAVDEMPLDMFMGTAVCLDMRHIPDLADVDVRDLEAAEIKAGVKIDGHIVLMCSGLTKKHYPGRAACESNWGLTAAATHWLADRGSKAHGVEGPSTDRPNWTQFPSHRVCRDRKIFHWEWLVNLDELVGKGEFFFSGVPLKIGGGSGSPVRAFAIV